MLLVAASALALSTAVANAAGAQDLAAAQAASERGAHDEAIKLYTQALADAGLTSEQRLQALRGRAGGYFAKTMIAETFNRKDNAERFGADSIADYTAAIKIKGDDAALHAARGQVRQVAGRNDEAIEDFSAALKLQPSTETYLQRAGALRMKGEFDRALADYDAALAAQPKKGGADEADVLNERAFTLFSTGKFTQAADDFAKAMTLGMGERAGDVLWLPYQTIWLHLARARAGVDDTRQLKDDAARVDLTKWPGTAVAYLLGQTTLQQLSSGSTHGGAGRGRECAVSFIAGEQALAKGDKVQAGEMLRRAAEVCAPQHVYSGIARQEVKRLDK